ncbi:MAG: phenylacetate--CoA ligase [Rhodospirillaceae bacterium]|nr:phenylacetate--CoA ligase [Rhodospirillaceae bacterium]
MPPADLQQRLWNPAVETLSRDALRDLQWQRLTRQLRYNFEGSAFYRAQFEKSGAEPGDIRSFEDFARLPLMDKADQRATQAESLERFGNPYELLACAPREKIVRIVSTSGTSGAPTLYTHTAHDIAVVNEMHARKYWRAGIRPGDVMLQAVSLSMFTGGLPLSDGIQHLGACVVPVGIEGGTDRVLQYLDLTRPCALLATPSFGRYLIEQAPDRAGPPGRARGARGVVCGGGPRGRGAAGRPPPGGPPGGLRRPAPATSPPGRRPARAGGRATSASGISSASANRAAACRRSAACWPRASVRKYSIIPAAATPSTASRRTSRRSALPACSSSPKTIACSNWSTRKPARRWSRPTARSARWSSPSSTGKARPSCATPWAT